MSRIPSQIYSSQTHFYMSKSENAISQKSMHSFLFLPISHHLSKFPQHLPNIFLFTKLQTILLRPSSNTSTYHPYPAAHAPVLKSYILLMDITIGGKYRLVRKIGSGSFGDIYQGVDDRDCPVAIKLEKPDRPLYCVLEHEASIYKTLQHSTSVPEFLWYGSKGGFNILVMEMLDKSLEDLKCECGGTLSVRTVLMLADQMISCLEYMHQKRVIHQDLKPENFMVGRDAKAGQVSIIDFGLSKTFVDPETGAHNPMKEHKSLTGTARYASINAMKYMEQSRRDDMESLGYIIIYLAKGSLPWQGLQATNRQSKFDRIREMKENMPLQELCKDLPDEFRRYLEMVRALGYEEEPKYADYRHLFRRLFLRCKFVYDYRYDWVKLREERSPELLVKRKKLPKIMNNESSTSTNAMERLPSRRHSGVFTARDISPTILPKLQQKAGQVSSRPRRASHWNETRHILAHKASAYVGGALRGKYGVNKVSVV